MLTDAVIVLLTVGMAAWGYFRGLRTEMLIGVGFAIGALLGSRVGPQLLDDGLHDPLAPLLALPGALLLGAAIAAGMERAGSKLRLLLRRRYTLDAVGGALLAAFVGVVLVWVVAAAAARIDGLEGTVRGSDIIGGLNSALPPPGPVLVSSKSYSAPERRRPGARRPPADSMVKQDPQVKAAADSVVKVEVTGCERRGSGSGWIAGDGIVMTNAHVVDGSRDLDVRLEGMGPAYDAQPIYYDRSEDIAILRVREVSGEPALALNPTPRSGAWVAVLGFPFGRRYKARTAKLGRVIPLPPGTSVGHAGRPARSLRAGLGLGPGVSGGPVVDTRGRVVAMVFAVYRRDQLRNQLGVPSPAMRTALTRARSSRGAVKTGECRES